MRFTILHAVIVLFAAAVPARAQPAATDDPFAKGRWRFETEAAAAVEAWNYNISHEELYGLSEGVTYGLRDGIVLRATQRLAYVSQRAEDAVLLGLTVGVRQRLLSRGRTSLFVQGDVGISHTAIATPPRGTRFNYVAMAGGGAAIRMSRRLQLLVALQVIHISNAGVKGPGRNPDLEAVGSSIGLSIGF